MDLYAYSQIEKLESILKDNNIEIPRLRGIRLMSEEEVISESDLKEAINSQICRVYENACCSVPIFCPESNMLEYSWRTGEIEKKYLISTTKKDIDLDGSGYEYTKTIGFRWELLHGKARKRLKFAVKKAERKVRDLVTTHNKYVGRADVVCVHARIGGDNWFYYDAHKTVEKQPWFLEKIDDYFDSTYCDIYIKIPEDKGCD